MTSLGDGICVVGYALNKKKLRKGDTDILSPLPPETTNIILEAPDSNCKAGDPCHLIHSSLSSVWKGGGLADLLHDREDASVRFLPVDFDLPPDQQPAFHVIIHKLTEDIRGQDPESKSKLQFLADYLKDHPSTVLVDPVEAVQKVICRSTVCRMLERIISQYTQTPFATANKSTQETFPCPPFSQPKHLIVEDLSHMQEQFLASQLRFPVICKPLEACGTPASHSMVVAVDLAGLEMVQVPSVLQEYRDHDMSFFKVYVIDQHVMVYQRPSLPNLQALLRHQLSTSPSSSSSSSPSHPHHTPRAALQSILFDSRFAYPTQASFFAEQPRPSSPASLCPPAAVPPSHPSTPSAADAYVRTRKPSASDLMEPGASVAEHQEQFEVIAAALRKEFGLTLFGFDCIIPSSLAEKEEKGTSKKPIASKSDSHSSSDCCNIEIIDINFFPSYKEVEDFPQKLKCYLRRRAGLE